ncbi:MAG: hypothetical protein JXR45_15580, partial [Deltaproteobacteria bacterium]|nr:hypothetical protein [Deltaproteobacteria bacterium]
MKNTVRRALLFLLAGVSCSVSRPVEQDEETDSCEPSSGDCRVDEEVTVSGDVADTAMSSDDAEDANDSSPDSSQPDTLPEWCNEAVDCLQNTWYPLPRATQAVSIRCNLDATDTCPAIDWDSSDPGVTSNFSSAISVYDSLGASHRTDVYFRKNCDEDLAWNYYVTVDGMELTDGTAYANHVVSSGLLRFTTDGYLLSETVVDEPVFNFQTATQGQIIDFDFGESIEDGGTGQYGTTSFAAQSIISHQVQDGYSTQGHWSCVDNTCEPVMGICSNGVDAPCCGDGTCNP